MGGATAVTIKAGDEQTDGTFSLGEVAAQPGCPGPPSHVHEHLDDMFHVLDGTLTDGRSPASPGTVVLASVSIAEPFGLPT